MLRLLACFLAAWVWIARSAAGDGAGLLAGPYAGGQMGYLWLDIGAGTGWPDDAGAGGLHLGYVFDRTDTLVGIELEVDTQNRFLSGQQDVVQGLARLKLRAGQINSGTYLYGIAGLSAIETTAGHATGWSLGIGAEVPVSPNWRLGAELVQDRFPHLPRTGSGLSLSNLNFRASFGF